MAIEFSNKALLELAQECERRAHFAQANGQPQRVPVHLELAQSARNLVAFRQQEEIERKAKQQQAKEMAV